MDDIIIASNLELVEAHPWTRRKTGTIIDTIGPVTVLLCNVTAGSSVVTSVNFSASMVGRLIRIGNMNTYYWIKDVVPGVSIHLGDIQGNSINYPYITQTGLTATVFTYIYPMPKNAERVVAVNYNVPLSEADPSFFDRIDPMRVGLANPPTRWAHYQRSPQDVLSIQFWPVPSADISIRVDYLKTGKLDYETDTPLYHSGLLRLHASVQACAFLLARTGDQAWAALADKYNGWFERAWGKEVENDLNRASAPTAIQLEQPPLAQYSDFGLDHDLGAFN